MGKFLPAFFSPLGIRRAVPQIWDGFQTNIKLMVVAELLVLIFALLIAIVRGLPGRSTFPLRALAIGYTDFFRGTPLILVAYVWGFGIPALHAGFISNRSLFQYGIISLTLLYTGYSVAAVFFVILTIPFARFTDRLIKERERRERAQLV